MGMPKKKSSGLVKLVKFLLALTLLLAVFVVGATAMLPSNYEVSKSIVIDADRGDIHAIVGDLNRWPEWDPWKDDDPTIKVTLGDKTTGVGASQTWTSDQGPGSITFTRSDEETGVDYEMIFGEEAAGMKSAGTISYAEAGDGKTRVTWRFSGKVGFNPIMRFFAWQMDEMVGPVFENGLKKLKTAAEAG